MMTHCDMCGTEIKDSKCSCGSWFSEEEMKNNPILQGLEYFHEMRKFTCTSDAPHLGVAVVFFRGDYNDCKKVEKFIFNLKARPHYQ
jgi:hypothetical protein